MNDPAAQALHGGRETQAGPGGHLVETAGHHFTLQDVVNRRLPSNAHTKDVGPLEKKINKDMKLQEAFREAFFTPTKITIVIFTLAVST